MFYIHMNWLSGAVILILVGFCFFTFDIMTKMQTDVKYIRSVLESKIQQLSKINEEPKDVDKKKQVGQK